MLALVAGIVGFGVRPSFAAEDDAAGAATLLTLVNQERVANGLAPVAPRDDVTAIAVQWSHLMADAQTLAHNDGYFTRDTKTRLGATRVGENVAKNIDLLDAHRRLMASPQHRANILDPGFTTIGIGVVIASTGEYYVTEDFLVSNAAPLPVVSPAPTTPAPAPEPAPTTTSSSTSTSTTAARAATTTTAAPTATTAAPASSTSAPQPTTTDAPAPEAMAPVELAASVDAGGSIGPIRPSSRGEGLPVLLVLLAAALVVGDLVYVARNRKAIAA